ncbi:hypothetical protein [Jannaschia aquimarina]|uniref:Uncharacterized protein n=1 Tax=Jannaschia aquimarina TaxID=935700 RepID=A0A0D1D875_9RHOB|nr:hypothetical protein [Jannaschia aquimarina]KIT16133.1 hypothetical protein jaqu_20950 [Jannaschia aquimarina]SNT37312.1 hypothetical protein SAMN05421775_11348 [Jannaschia aquimarina]
MTQTHRDEWIHRDGGRSALTVACLVFGTCILAVGWAQDASGFWLTVVGLPVLALAWLVVRNPRFETRLDAQALTLIEPRGTRVFPLTRIRHLEAEDWSDATRYSLHLESGEVIDLSSWQLATLSRTAQAFRARGVDVLIR